MNSILEKSSLKPTLLNICSIAYIIWDIYIMNKYGHDMELGGIIYLVTATIALFALLIDLILQQFIKSYLFINLIGLIVVLVFLLLFHSIFFSY